MPGSEPPEKKKPAWTRVVKDLDETDTSQWPHWLVLVRQMVVFLLGVAIICYSVIAQNKNIAYIVTGLILIGMIPIEQAIQRLAQRQDKRDERR